MPVEFLKPEDIGEFLPLHKSIAKAAWPHLPFDEVETASVVLEHIESPTATALVIREGERKAMMLLDTARVWTAKNVIAAVETTFGSTRPAPKNTIKLMLEAAQNWMPSVGATELVVSIGAHKGAAKFIQRSGGRLLHTAGNWSL